MGREQFGESLIPTVGDESEIGLLCIMPTKKQPSPRERKIASGKNHPVAKSNRPATAQNGEANPPRRKQQNRL
jgi:hypothetical protein